MLSFIVSLEKLAPVICMGGGYTSYGMGPVTTRGEAFTIPEVEFL